MAFNKMDRITFKVNGEKCSVSGEVDSDVSLNDYLRNSLNLRGTKFMCREGICGSCIVVVTRLEDGQRRTLSVNSCLVTITQCQDWEITTIEGIGDRRKGYHPVQKALAEHNGTQCGYCSPGWVMSMYGLLESNNYKLTQKQVEDSFGSNTCRCTGYRPILEAFKSFAQDAPKPKTEDIEDLNLCKNKGKCQKPCEKDWCIIKKEEKKRIVLKDGRVWYRVDEMRDIFDVLDVEGYESYRLISGNTGKGVVPILVIPKVLIDISPIEELKEHYFDQNLIIGAGTSLTDLMDLFKHISEEKYEFSYLEKLYEHLDLVAHIAVRNIGSIAGNLMTKHDFPNFNSDIFLLFETIGATLTIVDKTSKIEVTLQEFLSLDMRGRVISSVSIPPLSPYHLFISFKIMPRSQNALAEVDAGYLYELDKNDYRTVVSARIVYGGLSSHFNRAYRTEQYLVNKKLFSNDTLQGALKVLCEEIVVVRIAGKLGPEFRKKLALSLFYKGLLVLIPQHNLTPKYRSGARMLRRTRPVSSGTQVFDTNPSIWPITEPMPKVEALPQCAGEVKYVNDMATQPKEVFCAFVTSDIAVGEILSIDPSPALKIPGVLNFFSAKDIPGVNNYLSVKVPLNVPEEIFSDGKIKYYDQAIGVIVAETERLAYRAALLVEVKYKIDRSPIQTINEIKKKDPSRVSLANTLPATSAGSNVTKVIKDNYNIKSQYFYSMETLSCVSLPNDDGLDVYPASQWPDSVHVGISEALNLPQNRINLTVARCGGAYGVKLSRATHISVVCAMVTYLLNRPCRFVMSLQSNMRVIGKRNPCTVDFETGVNDSGEIQYLEYHLFQDSGYVVSDSSVMIALPAMRSCYNRERWSIKTFNVTTDTASNTFCRSPGTLEAIAMTEMIMEQISYRVDKDPIEVRLQNLNPTLLDVAEVIQTLIQDSEYNKRKDEVKKFNSENRWKKRGFRVATMSWPHNLTVDYSTLLSVYHGDGTVVVRHGGCEIGQGINTKVIQAVAYTLNIDVKKVKVKPLDTVSNPNTEFTANSRGTQSVCFSAIKCCQLLLDRLSAIRETLNDPTWEQLIDAAFTAGVNLQTSYHANSNDQATYRLAAAAATEVELDVLTGEHDILRVDIIEDAGTSLNPEIDIGQIEGGFIMGAGYWTTEHLIYDEKTGELLTDRAFSYHVPLAKDIPIDFRVKLRRNSYNPLGVLGAKSVAEPPTCLAVSVAFALREAITAAREDHGIPRTEWYNVDGPFTIEECVMNSKTDQKEFLL